MTHTPGPEPKSYYVLTQEGFDAFHTIFNLIELIADDFPDNHIREVCHDMHHFAESVDKNIIADGFFSDHEENTDLIAAKSALLTAAPDLLVAAQAALALLKVRDTGGIVEGITIGALENAIAKATSVDNTK